MIIRDRLKIEEFFILICNPDFLQTKFLNQQITILTILGDFIFFTANNVNKSTSLKMLQYAQFTSKFNWFLEVLFCFQGFKIYSYNNRESE